MKRLALTLLLVAVGCAHYRANVPLQQWEPSHGYRFSRLPDDPQADETFVILTFSGGGTRAAALSYGALRELAGTKIRGGRTLLDEVDVMSTISGGSFTGMAYALEHRFPMPDFEQQFLYHDVQGDLFRAAINPMNWPRLLSPHYSRIDLATDYYDRHVFSARTYADLTTAPRRPYLIVGATEMDLGSRFEFTQEQFDPICSDLDHLRVARAVAASSAFPGLLTPIVLKNYAGKCAWQEPEWIANAMEDRQTNPVRQRAASDVRELERTDRPWLHLMDGGVADNIGLRGPLRSILSTDPEWSVLRMINNERIKRLVVIVVNAKTEGNLQLDRSERTPSAAKVLLGTVANAPMANYSSDTVAQLEHAVDSWRKDALIEANCTPGDESASVQLYRVEVAFNDLPEPERTWFNSLGTNFSLKKEEVDRLIEVAGKLMRQSPEYQKLVADLQ